MRRYLFLLVIALPFAFSGAAGPAPNQLSAAPSPSPTGTPAQTSIVLSIPVGEGGVALENDDAEELEPWGPTAFTSGPDGTLYVADAVNSKILRFRPDKSQLPSIEVANAVLITDITVSNDTIYVLDQGVTPPAIIELNLAGELKEKVVLSTAPHGGLKNFREVRSLSGLELAADQDVLLQFEAGAATRNMDKQVELAASLRSLLFSVRMRPLRDQAKHGGRAEVLLNGNLFAEIKVDNLVAQVKVLGPDNAGDVFVVVDEITPTAEVNIDQTVRRYASNGDWKGMARVPIRDMYTFMEDNVKWLNGEVKAFITRKNKADLEVPLTYQNELPAILPKVTFVPSAPQPAAGCMVKRNQIAAMAEKYIANKVFLKAENIDEVGACDGRKKPHYLREPKEYSSVPYDWGGFDTVESFNQLMKGDNKAGDITSAGNFDCSRGIDCSGFVLRSWGFKDRGGLYTGNLSNISGEINILELLPGDILNRAGKHVVLFQDHKGGTNAGLEIWEATTQRHDRVIRRPTSWRRWLGYVARRYRNVC